MFHLQARAAAGFSRMASLYGRQWETMLDGEGNALELDASDAHYIISACIDADRDDGLGAHTDYRVVEVVCPRGHQAKLDYIGEEITAVVEQLGMGLITLTEFVDTIASFKRITDVPDGTAGLLCPFTGLRYPTVAESDAFIASLPEL